MAYAERISDSGVFVSFHIIDGLVGFTRVGGGFLYKVVEENFFKEFKEVDGLPKVMELGRFYLDMDGDAVEGWHNPNYLWNGWKVPRFDKEQFIKAIAYINESFPFDYDFDTKTIISSEEMDDDTVLESVVDGVVFYEFNGWCWEKEEG